MTTTTKASAKAPAAKKHLALVEGARKARTTKAAKAPAKAPATKAVKPAAVEAPPAEAPAAAEKPKRALKPNYYGMPEGRAAVHAGACPQCKAAKGDKCVNGGGQPTAYVHPVRMPKAGA